MLKIKRPPVVDYIVIWRWHDNESSYREVVRASNALRAIVRVRKDLAKEYAFAPAEFVPLEVIRKLLLYLES